MCAGASYRYEGKDVLQYFPNPQATLPVRTRESVILLPWGKRKEQSGSLPNGGWARLESIHEGKWEKYSPISVKLPIGRFMEKDSDKKSHWFDVDNGEWIQGLVARAGEEVRVYVVTVEPPLPDAIHNRWPRIMAS